MTVKKLDMNMPENERNKELQQLIDLLKSVIKPEALTSREAIQTAQSIFSALDQTVGKKDPVTPLQLPVSTYYTKAINNIRQQPHPIHLFADILSTLAPKLAWRKRSSSRNSADEKSHIDDNIANTILIGPTGLEQRHDVIIGMTLMAPNILYSDHHHLPDEIYTVLSAGAWRQNKSDWHEPGFGGLVFNPSNIIRAFKSKNTPLLAIWCLWC